MRRHSEVKCRLSTVAFGTGKVKCSSVEALYSLVRARRCAVMVSRWEGLYEGDTEAHWYEKDGTPAYDQPNASKPGEVRPTTVRDARKLGLLPSVTVILRMIHKEALQRYLINQHLLSAVTLPMIPGETTDAFIRRVVLDARKHGEQAAQFGTRLHQFIEFVLSKGESPPPLLNIADLPIATELESWLKEHVLEVESLELNLANPDLGYGGRLDAIGVVKLDTGTVRCLIDWKTQETREENKHRFNHYETNAIQGAAYSVLLGEPYIPCLVLYIDSKIPGLIEPVLYTNEKQPWRWPAFMACKYLYYEIGPWAAGRE